MNADDYLPSKRRVLRVLAGIAGAALTGAVLYASYVFNGVLSTAVYATVFVVSFALIPTAIGIAGAGMPGNAGLGRAHIVLGAFAFGHHYLVQLDDKWDWCPGDEGRVYINGQWHSIDGGHEHLSVLGWRPFGILRFKTDDSMQDIRADEASSPTVVLSDGGAAGGSATATPV